MPPEEVIEQMVEAFLLLREGELVWEILYLSKYEDTHKN